MPESKKTAETQPEKKNGHKPEPQPVAELASEYAGLPGLSADLLKAAHSAGARNEPGEAHAEWLGDRRVRSAQRVALASQIGHVHGNQHLQRVLASMIVTSNAPQAALTAKGNGNGNGRHNSGHGLPVIQREEDSEEGRPTEEEKARALAAAKAAEGVASQAESEGRSQIDKSKVEKNAEQNASQAARGKVEQAKAESATKSGAATGKKAPSIEKVSKEAPAEEKAEAAQAAAVLSPVPGKNGKGPSAVPVEGKAPASASDDPAFQAVIGNARNVGEKERSHAPSKQKADQAQSAAEPPASEIEARAQSNQVGEMERAETPAFDAGAFKASLMKRIAELAPKSMKEADDFKSSNKLGGVKDEMQAKSAEQQNLSKKNLAEKTAAAPDTGSIEPKPVTPLPPADPGAPPPDIGAAAAAPKVKAQSEVEAPLKENTQKVDDEMAEAGVTEEQLAKSNEPEFIAALDAKKEAHRQTAEAPQEYRLFEQEELGKAEGEAVALAQEKAQSMHGDREGLFSQVEGKQSQAKSEDEQAREKVAADLQKIYAKTKTKVETILSELDGKVETAFEAGAAAAKQAFEDYVEAKMEAYKEDRYGGWFGWARWAKDKLLGMPSAVNAFYEEGRQLFIKKMDAVIDNVTAIIATGITEAKAEIANGKKEILEYIAKLPEDLRKVGQKANQAIQEKFDALNESVNNKVDELVDTLANKYQEHLQAVDARIEELKAANAGLVEKAINAVVGAIKIIIQLGELLLNVLARISGIVGDILDDPIGFLGNMIDGIKLGFQNFVKRIKTHLITGLVTWLTGALGPMGIKLPDDLFSLEGIFSLVIQVLGLGWDYIRAKAVKLLGEPVVKALETGFEIFQILINEGPIGLWRYVKEQFADLKETVLDMIQETIISEVIEAGVNWVLSLLTPAGAFIKAAKAIYKIVTFFFEKAGQIADFINAVIDGIAAVASGSISAAAGLIESALAKAIPLIIGFLSSLLGIGDLPEKIHKIIKKVRGRVDKAIDGLIMKAKKFAGKMLRKLGIGKPEEAPTGDVKAQAQGMLTKRLQGEKTLEEAEAITKSVLDELRPKGLKKLYLKPVGTGEENSYSIVAESSPANELLKLNSKIPMAKGASVVSSVALTLGQPVEETLPIETEERRIGSSTMPEAGKITKEFVKEGAHGTKGTVEEIEHRKLGKRKFATLPGEAGYKGSRGALFIPETGSKRVELMTWNVGRLNNKVCSNHSHAEVQFINWFKGRPKQFRHSVIGIEIANKPYSPCAFCATELASFLSDLKKETKNNSIQARISWTEVYFVDVGCKELTTTVDSLGKLQSAGWVLDGKEWPSGEPPEKVTTLELVK